MRNSAQKNTPLKHKMSFLMQSDRLATRFQILETVTSIYRWTFIFYFNPLLNPGLASKTEKWLLVPKILQFL